MAERATTLTGPSDQALKGLTVLELGRMVSGPFCGKLLVDLGAEVIKIESPGAGDDARRHGPFPEDVPHPERSGLFLGLNAGKLSITLDPSSEHGRALLARLIDRADVLVTNKPPGLIEDLGLTYEALKGRNPQIVVTAVTPFGMTGPYRGYRAENITLAASSGVSMGAGTPGRVPLQLPLEQCMYQAGLVAMTATMSALLARQRTGVGRMIDVSEEEAMTVLHTGSNVLTYIFVGVAGLRQGKRGSYGLYPQSVFRCKDGWVIASAPQLDQWTRFLAVLGDPEWASNPRYRDRRKMQEEYPDEVDALLQPWFSARTKREILDICLEHRIPFTPVFDAGEVMSEPHLAERAYWVELDHDQAGTLRYPGPPYRFSATPWRLGGPAPHLGEHNELIYAQTLGLSPDEIAALAHEGVI